MAVLAARAAVGPQPPACRRAPPPARAATRSASILTGRRLLTGHRTAPYFRPCSATPKPRGTGGGGSKKDGVEGCEHWKILCRYIRRLRTSKPMRDFEMILWKCICEGAEQSIQHDAISRELKLQVKH